jgi:hypothetical protein
VPCSSERGDSYLILTAYHVVDGSGTIYGKKFAYREVTGTYRAKLLTIDAAADVALLTIRTSDYIPTVPLAKREPRIGFRGKFYGCSEGCPKSEKVTVSHCDWQDWIGTCNPEGGDSGGPLVDEDERLVGLVRARGIFNGKGYFVRWNHLRLKPSKTVTDDEIAELLAQAILQFLEGYRGGTR